MRQRRLTFLWPSLGVAIILVGGALDNVSGALGGTMTAFGGLFVSANIARVWALPPAQRIWLLCTLAGFCVAAGIVGGLLWSWWEWLLVVYGAALVFFAFVPVRRDVREAAARANSH